MAIYDKLGNMVNEHACEVACDMAQQARELFDNLFIEGMTIVEARALSGFLKIHIDMEMTRCTLRWQEEKEGNPVAVTVMGKLPACLDKKCKNKFVCANHITADDIRSERGLTPDLVKTGSGWQCNREAGMFGDGAILTDGSYIGEYNE